MTPNAMPSSLDPISISTSDGSKFLPYPGSGLYFYLAVKAQAPVMKEERFMQQRSSLVITTLPAYSTSRRAIQAKKQGIGEQVLPVWLVAIVLAFVVLAAMACGWYLINREPTRQESSIGSGADTATRHFRAQLPNRPTH